MAYLGNAPVVGDSTNSFKLLDDIASFTLTFDATDTSVVSISGDTLSFTDHRFVTGQKVTYTDGGGTAIGGLTDGTSYFIIKVDQNTIKLATNASNAASSTAIDLTSGAAGGSHTLKVAFDGVNTKFKATFNNGKKAKISRAGQISLSINGVIQQPQETSSPTVGYSVEADSTIVFSTAPVVTDKVFATFIGEVAASFDLTDNTIDNFTGDGSTTIFNLSKEVPSSEDVLVTLDGVTQHPSDGSTTRSYSIINQALTFVSAPDTGVAIQARHIGFAGATTSAVTGFYGRTGNVALKNTDDVSVQNISGVGATFTSNVNIEGVLTYEDVTNVDSIGIITARAGVLVGSGITLSKDGDVFFTGIATGNGSGLTALNASNLGSGTVPTARLGSGTASSSTFLRGDSTFAAVTSTTINNNADNRIITGSGTANTLNGEANLTFDGTTLKTEASNPILELSGTAGTSGNTFMHINANANHWCVGADNYSSQNLFVIKSGTPASSTHRFAINSSGYIGINNTSPKTDLDIANDAGGTLTLSCSDDSSSADQLIGKINFYTADPSGDGPQNNAIISAHSVESTGSGAYLKFSTATGATGSEGADAVERLRITSGGIVQIGGALANGTTDLDTSNSKLTIKQSANNQEDGIYIERSGERRGFYFYVGGALSQSDAFGIASQQLGTKTDVVSIDRGGDVVIGSGKLAIGNASPQQLLHVWPDTANTTSAYMRVTAGDRAGTTGLQIGHDVNGGFQIQGVSNGSMYWSTNNTVRMSLRNNSPALVVGATGGWDDYSTSEGILQAYATSTYGATKHCIKAMHANTSYTEDGGGLFFIGCRRTSTSDYTMAGWYTGDSSSGMTNDRQFRFIADGNAYADGSWNGGGADYAEFFEWLDGNSSDENRRGISVVLDNGKIRAATGSDNTDNIIGVISANPVVVGDSASERWKEKWITDDFGGVVEETYTITEWTDSTTGEKVNYATDSIPSDVTVGAGSSVLSTDENGNAYTRKKLNPSWDSTATYIPRKDRKEWDIVGLMGKLKVKSDQPIGTKWIKIREVSASVHEYLIR